MRALLKLHYAIAYYLSWLWFGLGGLLLNVFCAVLLLIPARERLGHTARAAIRALFAFWFKWCHATGVFRIKWSGFEHEDLSGGTIYVANHPTLVDAPVLLSRLPDTICIFKPALLRNPVIAPAAILAGYASGDAGVDLIREAAQKVAQGRSLLIFPEGTRTSPGQRLGPLKPGFAVIAQRSGAPIRLVVLRSSRSLVPRGRAWWKLPALPSYLEVTLGEIIPADFDASASEITALVQERLASSAAVVSAS